MFWKRKVTLERLLRKHFPGCVVQQDKMNHSSYVVMANWTDAIRFVFPEHQNESISYIPYFSHTKTEEQAWPLWRLEAAVKIARGAWEEYCTYYGIK